VKGTLSFKATVPSAARGRPKAQIQYVKTVVSKKQQTKAQGARRQFSPKKLRAKRSSPLARKKLQQLDASLQLQQQSRPLQNLSLDPSVTSSLIPAVVKEGESSNTSIERKGWRESLLLTLKSAWDLARDDEIQGIRERVDSAQASLRMLHYEIDHQQKVLQSFEETSRRTLPLAEEAENQLYLLDIERSDWELKITNLEEQLEQLVASAARDSNETAGPDSSYKSQLTPLKTLKEMAVDIEREVYFHFAIGKFAGKGAVASSMCYSVYLHSVMLLTRQIGCTPPPAERADQFE
jgi:hypothetical protein